MWSDHFEELDGDIALMPLNQAAEGKRGTLAPLNTIYLLSL